MYAMSHIQQDTMMNSSQNLITTVSLMNGSTKSAQLLNKDLLYPLDGLFAEGGVIARCFTALSGATVV